MKHQGSLDDLFLQISHMQEWQGSAWFNYIQVKKCPSAMLSCGIKKSITTIIKERGRFIESLPLLIRFYLVLNCRILITP